VLPFKLATLSLSGCKYNLFFLGYKYKLKKIYLFLVSLAFPG